MWRMELLHPAMWHDHDIDFARWLHPAMWQVALGWHAMEFCQTSAILEFYICFRFWVNMSFCTSLRNFIKIGPHSAKKLTSCRFSRWRISAILDFKGPIMGSLKSPCTTSYKSSIETISLNCLVFQEIAFLHFGVKIQNPKWRISAILDFRGPIMGCLKSQCTIGRQ